MERVSLNIGNLVSCYPTKQFLEYVDEFRSIEELIRKGKSLISDVCNHPHLMHFDNTTSDPTRSDIDNELLLNPPNQPSSTEQSSTILLSNSPTQDNQENQPITSNNHPNAQPSSTFQLKFKQSLVQKGRPRKRTTQICFNRTAQDKKQKASGGKKTKN